MKVSTEEITVRTVLLGLGGVGKDSWLRALYGENFSPHYNATLEPESVGISCNYMNVKATFRIRNVPGQNMYGQNFSRGWKVDTTFIVMFTVNNRLSALYANNSVVLIRRNFPDAKIVFVANKIDTENAKPDDLIPKDRKGKPMIDCIGIPVIGISAKTGDGIQLPLIRILEMLLN